MKNFSLHSTGEYDKTDKQESNNADSAYDDVAIGNGDSTDADSTYDDVALLRNDKDNDKPKSNEDAMDGGGSKRYTHLTEVGQQSYQSLEDDGKCMVHT